MRGILNRLSPQPSSKRPHPVTSWAGVFEGDISVSGNCSGCSVVYVGVNHGDATIVPGDLVAAAGVEVDAATKRPVLLVKRAAAAGDAVIGVEIEAGPSRRTAHARVRRPQERPALMRSPAGSISASWSAVWRRCGLTPLRWLSVIAWRRHARAQLSLRTRPPVMRASSSAARRQWPGLGHGQRPVRGAMQRVRVFGWTAVSLLLTVILLTMQSAAASSPPAGDASRAGFSTLRRRRL